MSGIFLLKIRDGNRWDSGAAWCGVEYDEPRERPALLRAALRERCTRRPPSADPRADWEYVEMLREDRELLRAALQATGAAVAARAAATAALLLDLAAMNPHDHMGPEVRAVAEVRVEIAAEALAPEE